MVGRQGLVAALFTLLVAGTAQADKPKVKVKKHKPVDIVAMVEELADEVRASTRRPRDGGHDDKLHEAWKLHVSKKARRMVARPRDLAKDHLWIVPEGKSAAAWLKPSQWSGAVKRLAGLYTELGTAAQKYGRVNVSGTKAVRQWDRNNPPPKMKGLTPAGVQRVRVERLIDDCIRAGEVVPTYLRRDLASLIALEAAEIREREERYERWKKDKVDARKAIEADVQGTKDALRAQRDVFYAQMKKTRELCAAMQVLEEKRMRGELDALPEDDPVHTSSAKHLSDMEKGRKKALRDSSSRTSKWGTLVRQGWMVPRNRLKSSIGAAKRRLANPIPKGEDPAPPKDGS